MLGQATLHHSGRHSICTDFYCLGKRDVQGPGS
uniref:Uncharacterized protein n=1 Tax=Anguilla anguilla TaxID=7936 RepID=A0A0E9TKM6_ANGAN